MDWYTRNKMVLHLTLVLGLICAGVAVGETSSAVARSQEDADHLDTNELVRRLSESLRSGKKDCNECLRTTIRIIKKASDALKYDENFWAYDPCKDFPNNQKEICYNIIDYVKRSPLDILESRKICIKAAYCSSKDQNPNHKPQPKVAPNVKGVRRDNEATTPKPTTKKPPAKADVENQALEKDKLQLKFINPQLCEDCHTILEEMKKLLNEGWYFPSTITSVCEAFPRRSSCYQMVYQNEEIISNLISNSPNHEICTTIKWCQNHRVYPYCQACQNFLYYDYELENESYYWENFACNYLEGHSKRQCMEALKERKKKMIYFMEHDYGIYRNCAAVNLCQKLGKA